MSNGNHVGAYLRVSTDEQAEKFGIDAQKRTVHEWAVKKGYTLSYYIDEGVSGNTEPFKRPGLSKWIEDAIQKRYDIPVVPKLDRLSRNLFYQLWIEKELLKHGIEITSISEPNGHDPMATAFRQMMGVFAELERNIITQRTSAGRLEKAKRGGFAGGPPPLGFKLIEGKLVPENEQLKLVKKIFQLYKEVGSFNKVAYILNDMEVQPPRGRKWYASTISGIINNPKYRGRQVYSGDEYDAEWDNILETL